MKKTFIGILGLSLSLMLIFSAPSLAQEELDNLLSVLQADQIVALYKANGFKQKPTVTGVLYEGDSVPFRSKNFPNVEYASILCTQQSGVANIFVYNGNGALIGQGKRTGQISTVEYSPNWKMNVTERVIMLSGNARYMYFRLYRVSY
ncbi:MAG: hypothetical protein HQK58_10350 [Deltaproteobacteria bacterium]|nr:hypothetical protein [Deltaproteobacteria bacterium]